MQVKYFLITISEGFRWFLRDVLKTISILILKFYMIKLLNSLQLRLWKILYLIPYRRISLMFFEAWVRPYIVGLQYWCNEWFRCLMLRWNYQNSVFMLYYITKNNTISCFNYIIPNVFHANSRLFSLIIFVHSFRLPYFSNHYSKLCRTGVRCTFACGWQDTNDDRISKYFIRKTNLESTNFNLPLPFPPTTTTPSLS